MSIGDAALRREKVEAGHRKMPAFVRAVAEFDDESVGIGDGPLPELPSFRGNRGVPAF